MTFQAKYSVFTLLLASAISSARSVAQDGPATNVKKGGLNAVSPHTIPPSWREDQTEYPTSLQGDSAGNDGGDEDMPDSDAVLAKALPQSPAFKLPDAPLVMAPREEGSRTDPVGGQGPKVETPSPGSGTEAVSSGTKVATGEPIRKNPEPQAVPNKTSESEKGARNVPGKTAQGQEALPGVPPNDGGEPAKTPQAEALANSPAPAAAPDAQGKAGGPDTRGEPLEAKGGRIDGETKASPGVTTGRAKETSTTQPAPSGVAVSPGIKERAEGGKKTLSIGANPVRNVPEIERIDDDEGEREGEGGASGKGPIGQANAPFRRGPRVQEPGLREETVRYVYVSRGSWLIKLLQPHIDRLAIHVIRADSSDVSAGYTELTRTFAYLCALIAADDGSEKMLRKVGEAVSIHRKAISALRLSWARKDEAVEKIFNDYIEATFFKDLNRDAVRIPAGGLSASEYRTLRETYADQLDANDGKPSDFPILGGK